MQGDPLGPILFCLVIRELTKSLISPFNVWYSDDGIIGGDVDSVLSDLETVVSAESKLGLELNMAKCEIFVFHEEADILWRGGSRKPSERSTSPFVLT